MGVIKLQGHIIVPQQDVKVIQDALPKHIQLTRKEKGCIRFKVKQDLKDPRKFHVDEEFLNQNALLFHQTRAKNSTWGTLTSNVERFYEINEVKK